MAKNCQEPDMDDEMDNDMSDKKMPMKEKGSSPSKKAWHHPENLNKRK